MMEENIELNDAEEDILSYMSEEGKATPQLISNETKYSYPYVNQIIKTLDRLGMLEKKARGLYEITEKGKKSA